MEKDWKMDVLVNADCEQVFVPDPDWRDKWCMRIVTFEDILTKKGEPTASLVGACLLNNVWDFQYVDLEIERPLELSCHLFAENRLLMHVTIRFNYLAGIFPDDNGEFTFSVSPSIPQDYEPYVESGLYLRLTDTTTSN